MARACEPEHYEPLRQHRSGPEAPSDCPSKANLRRAPPFLAQERDGFGVAGEALNYRCKVELATARMPAFKGLSQMTPRY